MLELKGIVKNYAAGDMTVNALRGIDLRFRRNEFVSILGPSGCGKTTLLNIIGGLDKYTEGDLVINGRSTKDFRDRDWDAYRNHSIGFVFQSYNLIPHQTVLQNVELSLTLSGIPKAERKARAIKALEDVGLGTQLRKKPTEMSGGQMQRVAIARALVNNPDIILADEPTGALDTETSLQVMDILKKVAENRLVIMVTHNPELAAKYSTRIVRMLDGRITGDSAPLSEAEIKAEVEKIKAEGRRAPHLAAVLVGDNGASVTYVNSKVRSCEEVGFDSTLVKFPDTVSQKELLDKIAELNDDPAIDGFIVQLPLPAHIDEKLVT
ncbi:MAG: ATP-binding cassette domain-containing protein, partial [Ruminococcus sp.]|nr:ATP-binding cassette domain-containing protein [Candidatus Apopatosoma intestinale]